MLSIIRMRTTNVTRVTIMTTRVTTMTPTRTLPSTVVNLEGLYFGRKFLGRFQMDNHKNGNNNKDTDSHSYQQ